VYTVIREGDAGTCDEVFDGACREDVAGVCQGGDACADVDRDASEVTATNFALSDVWTPALMAMPRATAWSMMAWAQWMAWAGPVKVARKLSPAVLISRPPNRANENSRSRHTGRCRMKAIVVTDQAAGTAGMTLAERPEPDAASNDVVVQVHASGFTPGELTWPGTWTDRLGRDRTPSIPGHELAGVVSALGYGTAGLSVGRRVFGLTDWTRDGTLAEYVAVEARNLAPLPGDVDFTVGASLPISGLTAWQGLFVHGRVQAGQSVLVHGAAGGVGSMVTQLAREAGAHVIGTGRAADRQTALDFGANEFVDLDNDALEDVGGVDLVFDVIGGDIQKRSAGLIRTAGTLVTIAGPPEARPADGLAIDFVVEADRAQLGEIVRRVRDGRLRTNIGNVSSLADAVAAFSPTERIKGKTIISVRP
jgi:NADPH:quinone reductase-like Zn-dependent oxidoreductase